MIPAARYCHRQRATTMLYMLGIVAVLTILMFGLSDQTLRHTRGMAACMHLARAEWLLRSAPPLAAARDQSGGAEWPSVFSGAAGKLVLISGGGETTATVRATASVPPAAPRLVLTRTFPLQP